MNALRPRRWLRFSLSSLLVVITFTSVWLGWWRHRALQQKAAVAAITECGAQCYYDYQIVNKKHDLTAESPVPKWLLDRLGYDYFHGVVEVNFASGARRGKHRLGAGPSAEALQHLRGLPLTQRLLMSGDPISDEGLKYVAKLRGLKALYMWDAVNVTDAGIAHLQRHPLLEHVHCSHAQITDESLRCFATLPQVTGLSLQGNAFTDRGLHYVKDLVKLKKLCVGQPAPGTTTRKPITDAGLQHLRKLQNLELLDLQATQVTPDGLAEISHLTNLKDLWAGNTAILKRDAKTLQAKLPGCSLSADEQPR